MHFFSKLKRFAWKCSMKGLKRGPHITRYFMYQHLEQMGYRLPNRFGRVLSISDSSNIADLLKIDVTEIVESKYPESNILDLKYADKSFDFVFSDQVLEHVEGDPQRAIDECYRVLKPNGIAVHTTCFMNPVHGSPKDFWRFTPEALCLLHKNWGNIIDSGGWGNFDVWSVVNIGMRFEGVPHARWHPYHKMAIKNDLEWPIVTWVIAAK
jgi:SAM-dependent methyltransferase